LRRLFVNHLYLVRGSVVKRRARCYRPVSEADGFLGIVAVLRDNNSIELLDAVAKVLLRCVVFGFALLLLWVGAFFLAGDVIYGVHGKLFGLTPHELDLIHYCGIAFVKLCVLLFFLFPYLAIRLVLRRRAA
jgi:hypothetical protein